MSASPAPPRGANGRIAMILWGDVIEDYLDRIGLDISEFLGEVSGGWMFAYVDALRTRGIETVMVIVSERSHVATRTHHVASGIAVWLLPPSALFRLTSRLLRQLTGSGIVRRTVRVALREIRAYSATPWREFARVVRRESCRAIVCQEYESPRFDGCVVLGRALRLPVFATFQGGSRQHHRLERPVRQVTMRIASGLIVGAGAEADRVARRYHVHASKLGQIPNPLTTSAPAAEDRAVGRQLLGVADSTLVVCWHGRVEIARKGLDVLLEAWPAVLAGCPDVDVRLALMGSGGEAEQLRALVRAIGSSVSWIEDWVSDRVAINRFLAAGDVYAFPSPHEGFPMAPLEAMAAGLPVVATAAPGVVDIFGVGEDWGGIVVPVGDAEELARQIVRLLRDAHLRAALGDRALRRVNGDFSGKAVGQQLEEFFIRNGASLVDSSSRG